MSLGPNPSNRLGRGRAASGMLTTAVRPADCGGPAMSQPTAQPTGQPPAPPRVRLEGTRDMVRASDGSFTLRLADGRELPGRLVARRITTLATLLGRQILLFGTGQFGPTGELE